ncbi:Beta-hexosaminidase [Anaerohalosphaera lusitana]|uniref:beta-N-acetylhexosaminidase n=1 Tax=Anaerohalosphaera lusitana TaxID=1936003 RepID=A0A1U9NQX6_9BACT|nr:NPCBM/NEW2 domain-containing protein [Anaerohalosphaera lusitana]AQT69916.1 Beta-hexosaminidase [Anaerohalosphaera lusitana]
MRTNVYRSALYFLLLCVLACCTSTTFAAEVYLDELQIENITQGWGSPQTNRSVDGNPISISGNAFKRGIGTHAPATIVLELHKTAKSFTAQVGVDDELGPNRGSVTFKASTPDKTLNETPVMTAGDKPREFTVDLTNLRYLILEVTDAGDGNGQDHADLANAKITYTGQKPRIIPISQLPRPVSPTNRANAPAALIPYPQKVEWTGKRFNLIDSTRVSINNTDYNSKNLENVLSFLIAELQPHGIDRTKGFFIGRPNYLILPNQIRLHIDEISKAPVNADQAYSITVTDKGATVTAPNAQGLYHGTQTLLQLVKTDGDQPYIPTCKITDWPAFKYRGLMHDLGRNYQSPDLLKKQIDLLAQYKFNVFHMHLTDYPGFRIESIKYPELNDPANYRATRQPGKFYTYDQLNEIINYCRDRHILVIPEIDMPGHSTYFNETFGVDMQSEKGTEILKNILDEFFDHIDLPIIHIGSDEVHISNPDFMPTMVDFIRKHDKDIVVWRPGHLPDKKVITQLWSRGPKPVPGVRYIDSQANYVNHMDPLMGPVRAFFQQPCRVPQSTDLALGGILCHWPDNNVGKQINIYRQSPVFPAMLAYADRIWRGAQHNRYDLWAKLPAPHTDVFDEFAQFESDMLAHRDKYFTDMPFPYVKQTDIRWRIAGPFDHQGDFDSSFPPEDSIQPDYTFGNETYNWRPATGGTVFLRHHFGFPSYITSADKGTVYALGFIKSDHAQDAHMWIGFHDYSRSGGRRGGPFAQLGQWHTTDPKIWLNDEPIDPPEWNNPGLARNTKEIPFTDEGYIYREPTKIKLRKGWNKIFLKVPHGGTSWKWMFTAVPVKWDGKRATELTSVRFATDAEYDRLIKQQK